jgi:hypothetical protein
MEYIYEKENSLDIGLCEQIINLFESSMFKKPGETLSGMNKEIKDTTDLHFSIEPTLFKDIDVILYNELNNNLCKYIEKVNKLCYHLDNIQYTDTGFQIQKYIKNTGKYAYHNDAQIIIQKNKTRILTFLWYLNDIEEGGETEFFGNYRIKPKCGKFIMFPSTWTFPHCGNIPKSSNKYIITGWIYKVIDI